MFSETVEGRRWAKNVEHCGAIASVVQKICVHVRICTVHVGSELGESIDDKHTK